jgi:hypothetical protein
MLADMHTQDDEGYISASAFAAYLGMRSNMQTMVRSACMPRCDKLAHCVLVQKHA